MVFMSMKLHEDPRTVRASKCIYFRTRGDEEGGGKRARLASGLSLKTPHGSAVSLKAPWRSMDKYFTMKISKKYHSS